MAALSLVGLALVRRGRVEEGMALLDEATAAAIAGEVGAHDVAGAICCDLIFACEYVHDFERASQWCLTTSASARDNGPSGLLGICRSHYATVLFHRGDWDGAEEELRGATELFERAAQGLAHEAVLCLGELRLRQGRMDEADELFERVAWHPHARLGQARVAFARRRPDAAAHHLDAHLRAIPASDVLGRVGGLSLAVALFLELGDRERARAVADELERAAAAGGAAPLGAVSQLALPRVTAAAGDHEAAARHAEDAATTWARVGMPYEEGEARALLADLLAAGAPDQAERERQRAAETFRRLGCGGQAERVHADGRRAVLSPREIEVLRLVADGLSDDQIAERLLLSPHTVHRHVANIRTKLRQSTRAGAAALAARDGLI
jgi:DNA-binding CsgD family transcriptional regulator